MNVQEIAQNLINEISLEVKNSEEKSILGKGAIQGVQEFFNRMQKAQEDEQNSKSESVSTKKKSKK